MLLTPVAHGPQSAPHLEFYPHGSDQLQRTPIERTPFRIGRCETCDLQIDSAEVSREHAQISRRGNIWVVRDLGSTNGTRVNGKPIRESFLADGDILSIAEIEVTFVASLVTPFQRMATQPIHPREANKPTALLPNEINQMRSFTEATLWQAIPVGLNSICSLTTGQNEATVANPVTKIGEDGEFLLGHATWQRHRELFRRRAIEQVQNQSAIQRVLIYAEVADFEAPQALLAFEQLRGGIGHDIELGVALNLASAADPAGLEQICQDVRQAGFMLALIDFQGSGAQVSELAPCAPDYLILSEVMLKGVVATSQPLRRLEVVRTTCEQLGIKAVLPQSTCQRSTTQCRQIGYDLALKPTEKQGNSEPRKLAALCH